MGRRSYKTWHTGSALLEPSDRLGHRLQMLVVAAFMPELIVSEAVSQWAKARLLRDTINEIGPQGAEGAQLSDNCGEYGLEPDLDGEDLHETNDQKHVFKTWEQAQALFAVSGGIAVDSSAFCPFDRLFFTPAGLLQLARVGLLPDIPQSEIDDRSKQDAVAKIIVCVQVGWYLAQSISRAVQGLPLALLELHVLTHIAFALAMYIIWFKKPYDIGTPYICQDPRIIDLAAFFSLHMGSEREDQDIAPCSSGNFKIDITHVRGVDYLPDEHIKKQRHLRAAKRAINYLKNHGSHLSWRVRHAPSLNSNVIFFDSALVVRPPGASLKDLVSYDEFEDNGRRVFSENKHLSMVMAVVSAIYGALHLSAWNFHFPTAGEKWAWRGSALSLLFAPFFIWFYKWVVEPHLYDGFRDDDDDNDNSRQRHGLLFLWMILKMLFTFGIGWNIYAGTRMYLFIECFISLRSPAPGTYDTVNWLRFLPHFA
ncbi:MAG: hypothetical protein Q9227_008413 [Pyrenula ochraceoflavens]